MTEARPGPAVPKRPARQIAPTSAPVRLLGPRRILGATLAAFLLAACADAGGEATAGDGGDPGAPAETPGERSRADSLIDAWIAAAGGQEAWDSVRRARYTVNTVWYDSTGAVERMRPRRVELRKAEGAEQARIERPEAEGLYVQTFTGDTAWAVLNGRPLPPDHPATEEAEYVGRDVVYWFGLPYKLRDPGVNRESRALPDGGYEVRVTFGEGVGAHPGDRYFYYFLDEDPWPEEVHYIEQGRTEAARNRTRWSDFQTAGPITYVGNRVWVDSAGRRTKALRIDDVWINPPLADSLFAPPDDPLASRDG